MAPRKRRGRKKKQKPGPKFAGDKMMRQHVRAIVNSIAEEALKRKDINGQYDKGYVTEAVAAHNDLLIPSKRWLNVNMVYKKVGRLRKQLKERQAAESATEASVATATTGTTASTESSAAGGRPAGTTSEDIRFRQDVIDKFKDNVTVKYQDYRMLKDWAFSHQKPNFKRTFEQIKEDIVGDYLTAGYDFIKDVSFTERAAAKRIVRGRCEDVHCGQRSPVLEMEGVLAQLLMQANRANCSKSRAEVIELANDLVDGGPLKDKAIAWKLKHNAAYRNKHQHIAPTSIELGDAWFFRGFLPRHPEVEYGKQTFMERNRASWCTYANVRDMYEKLYGYWLQEGYIEPLETPHHQDLFGNPRSPDAPDRVGRLVKYKWKYPDRVLCADEVGHNTNMSRDKTDNNDKAVAEKGERARVPAATDDCHYTCMCFTNMEGIPVLFVTIVPESYKLSLNLVLGADVSKDWIGDTSFFDDDSPIPAAAIRMNTGPGKRFPGGVHINYKGKEVPMLMLQSTKGSNTSELLTEIVKYMDKLEIFERNDNLPPPALLMDGHGSRFGIEFLSYVANKDLQGKTIPGADHEWRVYMGLPNCTGVWQVGDSSAQNGMFKKGLRAKARDIQRQQGMNSEELAMKEENIVPMIMAAYPESFGNVRTNKTAIAKRGWNPLNRNCLLHRQVRYTRTAEKYESDDESLDLQGTTNDQHTPSSLSTLTNSVMSDFSTSTAGAPSTPASHVYITDNGSRYSTSSSVVAGSLETLRRQRSRKLTRSERDLELRPSVVDKLGISSTSCQSLIGFLNRSRNRNIAQERRQRERMEQNHAQRKVNAAQIYKTGGRVGAGMEQKRGNYDLTEPSLLEYITESQRKKEDEEFLKSVRKYQTLKKRYDDGATLLERGQDKRKREWMSSELLALIKYKRLGVAQKDLEGTKIPQGKALRSYEWERRYEKLPNPLPPQKPDGYDAHCLTEYNVKVAEQRLKAAGLPWNSKAKKMSWFRCQLKNSEDFKEPIFNNDDGEASSTDVGFAKGLQESGSMTLNSDEWEEICDNPIKE